MKFERWNKTKLEEIVEINPRTSLKKGTVAKKVAMEHVKEFTRKISGFEVTEFKSGSKFINNDTLMARITPCLENGKTAYVDILEDDEVAFGSTEFFVLRSKEGKSDSKFIYYLSISEEFRKVAIQSMTGTSGRQRAQKDSLLNYELSVPSLKEQKKIGEILSLYDEKVESNNAIISNLEELAQTLFKHWFVDFEFPNEEGKPYKSSGGKMVQSELGMIPEGWEVSRLGDIMNQIGNAIEIKNIPKTPYIGLADMPRATIALSSWKSSEEASSNKTTFKKGNILFGKLRPYFKKVGIAPIDGICSTDIIVLNSKEKNYYSYLLSVLTSDNFIEYCSATATGTRMPRTGWRQMSDFKIIKPTLEVSSNFNSVILPLYDKVLNHVNENTSLSTLRDVLLPKLLSGEIELPDDMEVTDDVSIS